MIYVLNSLSLSLVIDCGPVDVSFGDVVHINSSNSTTFGSRLLYSCKSSPGEQSMALTLTSHWNDQQALKALLLNIPYKN